MVAILILGVMIGCRQKESPRVVVDVMDERPVVIAKDGGLSFEGKTITEESLGRMIEERVEKDRLSKVPSQFSTILFEPHPGAPTGRLQGLQNLIRKHGGTPGQRIKKDGVQPTSAGDSSPRADSEE